MPDALEYLVRPYQTPNAQGAIIIPSTPVGTHQRATLTWGTAATMPQPTLDPNSLSVQCCNEKQDELERQTQTVRINGSSDDDGNVWIDVERSQQLTLQKTTNDQNSACIPDVTFFTGATFSDGFEPQDTGSAGCKIVLTLKNNTQ